MKTYIFNISLEPDEEEARQHIYEVLSMIVEESLEEGRELPAGDGLVISLHAGRRHLRHRHAAEHA
jgi:hypothetical protein